MELFTLDGGFKLKDDIDVFDSAIWTERYFGDSDFQLSVPISVDMINKLKLGTKIYLSGSKEIMITDTIKFENGLMTISGGNLMQFLNNRVIRATAAHADRYWTLTGQPPGTIMAQVVQYMCISGPWIDGTVPTGIPPDYQKISTLSIRAFDSSGALVTIAVPYGPMFDALKQIGETYDIGQTITLEAVTDATYYVQYRNYKGADRTSLQTANPLVRFSPQIDSLADIKELQTDKNAKDICFAYAPGDPDGIADSIAPGNWDIWMRIPGGPIGPPDRPHPVDFGIRVMMLLAEDITTDQFSGDPAILTQLLAGRARDALKDHRYIQAVDGTIVPLNQYQYGKDYNLGDIVEVQGLSGAVSKSRVTEYIRAQDKAGERAYPTLAQVT